MAISFPASPTHSLVTRLAVSIAGKQVPYTRADLLKKDWQYHKSSWSSNLLGKVMGPLIQNVHWLRPGTLQLASLPPLTLYVHLPWCLKKCPYCDFNSHQIGVAELPEQRYVEALLADLEAALPLIWGRTVHSVFLGGGTPSLLSPRAIDNLLGAVRAALRLEPGCEITLEANPGSFEKDRFRAFRSAGVTRLSVGVQSFNDQFLKALGRVHDRAQALAAVEEAALAFETFNLDIMYALPGQNLADLKEDLRTALALEPPHISI
jgi:oxygen-independent coproporphyrinogen-3 oxidase